MLIVRSGETAQYLHFVAVASSDYKTRKTGIASWTIYRTRGGGSASLMNTPTVAEVDATNAPGLYSLLLDEDMTIASGKMSEVMTYHITATDMAPVTISVQLVDDTVFADTLLKRDMASVSGEASRSLLNAIRFLRNKWSVSGATLTVTKEDDATSAWTSVLTTNAAADPITGSDPS